MKYVVRRRGRTVHVSAAGRRGETWLPWETVRMFASAEMASFACEEIQRVASSPRDEHRVEVAVFLHGHRLGEVELLTLVAAELRVYEIANHGRVLTPDERAARRSEMRALILAAPSETAA